MKTFDLRNSGFSMIEVLVSLAILSLGLLGLAALHATALRTNDGANLRSQATNAAYDVIDMIRTNRANANFYNTNFTSAVPSGSAMHSADVRRWKQNLQRVLPNGQGQVVIAAQTVTVNVRWNDVRAGGSAAGTDTTTFTVTSRF